MELNAWHALVKGVGMIWYVVLALLALAWGVSLLRRVREDIWLENKPATGPGTPGK